MDKLEQYDQENEAVHNTSQRITILPLLALATHKLGQTDDALAILGRAVDLAEPGGFIRPFVDLGSEMAPLLQELVARRVADGSLRPATGSLSHPDLCGLSRTGREPGGLVAVARHRRGPGRAADRARDGDAGAPCPAADQSRRSPGNWSSPWVRSNSTPTASMASSASATGAKLSSGPGRWGFCRHRVSLQPCESTRIVLACSR